MTLFLPLCQVRDAAQPAAAATLLLSRWHRRIARELAHAPGHHSGRTQPVMCNTRTTPTLYPVRCPWFPYCALFLVARRSSYLYWAMLTAGIIAVAATGIFVAVCYPAQSKTTHAHRILLAIFGDWNWIHKHCETDWLFATWMIFVATYIATGGFVAYTIYEGVSGHCGAACLFLNISSSVDCFIFLVGSVYFVAGSYSEETSTLAEGGVETPS
ncbi:hypothetical protein T492DRAFT_1133343 [Pavlovales sp. CCMP2436]|nr:hypothetical protein T492DRAFT_1133343 [Pavlovales sp. CCMP2436]